MSLRAIDRDWPLLNTVQRYARQEASVTRWGFDPGPDCSVRVGSLIFPVRAADFDAMGETDESVRAWVEAKFAALGFPRPPAVACSNCDRIRGFDAGECRKLGTDDCKTVTLARAVHRAWAEGYKACGDDNGTAREGQTENPYPAPVAGAKA